MPKKIPLQKHQVRKAFQSKQERAKAEVASKVKSATELGLKAEGLGVSRKPKTHKGKKYLENKEAKLIENPKRSLLIKGNKTS